MAEVFDPNRLGLSSLQQNIRDAVNSPAIYPNAPSAPLRMPGMTDLIRAIPPANIPKIVPSDLPQPYNVRYPNEPALGVDFNRAAELPKAIGNVFNTMTYGVVPGLGRMIAGALNTPPSQTNMPAATEQETMFSGALQGTAPRVFASGTNVAREANATATPGQKSTPAPQAGDITGSPISIVRGLQNTDYLPTMTSRGQVQYKSIPQMQAEAATAAAAEQTAATLQKTKSETAKNASVLPLAQFQEKVAKRAMQLQDLLAGMDPNDAKYQGVQNEFNRLAAILQPKLNFMDMFTSESLASKAAPQ